MPVRPDLGFLVFAATLFVFHQAWAVLETPTAEAAVGVVDPFLVVAAAGIVVRGYGTPPRPALACAAAATLYVFARGAHLAADSIQREIDAPIVTFWDERFGHIVGVAGWVALLAAFCLAERARRRPSDPSRVMLAVAAALLGWTAFVSTVEGQTWWLELAATTFFVAWGVRSRRPLIVTVAAAMVLGAALIAGWAAWHGGVPEFTAV